MRQKGEGGGRHLRRKGRTGVVSIPFPPEASHHTITATTTRRSALSHSLSFSLSLSLLNPQLLCNDEVKDLIPLISTSHFRLAWCRAETKRNRRIEKKTHAEIETGQTTTTTTPTSTTTTYLMVVSLNIILFFSLLYVLYVYLSVLFLYYSLIDITEMKFFLPFRLLLCNNHSSFSLLLFFSFFVFRSFVRSVFHSFHAGHLKQTL